MSSSKHEGVSCDACMKSNFRGRRYKCLICYDYDLCGACRDARTVSGRHSHDHPMQCILTRQDMETYFGGETVTLEQGQSFTCPYCGEMGLAETDLPDHIGLRHASAMTDVLCPICATTQGGDPNHVTEDLLSHLSNDHTPSPDNPSGRTLGIGRGRFRGGRGGGGSGTSSAGHTLRTRERRLGGSAASPGGASNAGASTGESTALAPRLGGMMGALRGSASNGVASAEGRAAASVMSEASAIQHLLPPASALASSVRENVDSIADFGFAELLSQLTNVRRANSGTTSNPASGPPGSSTAPGTGSSSLTATFASTASSLQQLQMQLQMERQNLLFGRVDSLRNSQSATSKPPDARLSGAYMPFGLSSDPRHAPSAQTVHSAQLMKGKKERDAHSLLDKLMEEKMVEAGLENEPSLRADRALFIQELLMGTLGDSLESDPSPEDLDVDVDRPPMERENSGDSLASSCNATLGSSRAGSEFSFSTRPVGPTESDGGMLSPSDRRGVVPLTRPALRSLENNQQNSAPDQP